MTSAEALRAAAAVGPYFTWEPWSDIAARDVPVERSTGRPAVSDVPVERSSGTPAGADVPVERSSGAPAGGWRPLAELTDGDVLTERVGAARAALIGMFGLAEDDVPERVIASVTFLGLASRLLSPPLGAVALGGVLPVPRPDQLWWRPVPGGPWPIAYSGEPADGDFTGGIVEGLVAPVLAAFRDRFLLSPQVLWGNVASALAGAAGMLAGNRPEAARAAGELVERTLAEAPLAGTGTVVRPDPASERRFLVRHNCCLYYRIPGGGTCGDCVLTPEADRIRGWRSVLER